MPRKAKKSTTGSGDGSQAGPTQAQLKQVFTNSPDFKSIYSNFVQSGFTAFDIYLSFGETVGGTPDGTLPVEMKARVSMAPLEAKLVTLILASSVQKYEAQFGKIQVPQGVGLEGVPTVPAS